MLISMTGYGHGQVANQAASVSVEIRTVNHRFLDFSIKLPKGLSTREQDIKEIVRDKFTRGRIALTVSADTAEPECDAAINKALLSYYLESLRAFAREHKLPGEVDINTLALLPDVFVRQERENESEELWLATKEGLNLAIEACMVMREEEGKALEADLRQRVGAVQKLVLDIEKLAPSVIEKRTAVFRKRLNKAMEGATVNEDRWLTEIALLADKLDFTEEIIRLKSHVAQFEKILDEGGAVSKRLTYLLQEIHREATTISSKASDAEIVSLMVALKEETEKLREQVQNIE
jgi:uncharacterized protein (TIGR00255 family)